MLTLITGAPGSGGAPLAGVIAFSPGAAEKWRIDAIGNLNSVDGVSANVTADGAIIATGGIAFTDVLNNWIDDATHGDGTTVTYIGNSTIDVTAPSDARLKKNITPTAKRALPILRGIEMVDYDWKAGDDHARQFGWIAQQVQTVEPRLVGERSDGMLMVKCPDFAPYLVKAVQELADKLEAAEKRIARLEAEKLASAK